jgi:Leucine-rich repeat (LRR) protein
MVIVEKDCNDSNSSGNEAAALRPGINTTVLQPSRLEQEVAVDTISETPVENRVMTAEDPPSWAQDSDAAGDKTNNHAKGTDEASKSEEEVSPTHSTKEPKVEPQNSPGPRSPFEDIMPLPAPLPLQAGNPLHRAAAGVPGAHAIPSVSWNPPTHPTTPSLRPLFHTTPRVDTSVYYEDNLPQVQDELSPTPQNKNNDGLAEAQPVSEEEDPTNLHAVPVFLRDKGKGPFSILQTSLLAVLGLLLVGGIIAGGVCGRGLCGANEPTVLKTNPFPKDATSAPTTYYRDPGEVTKIEWEIKYVLGRDYFEYYPKEYSFSAEIRQKTLHWILYDDPLQLDTTTSQHLIQRFLLVLFYFYTTKETQWTECNPQSDYVSGFCYKPQKLDKSVKGDPLNYWGDYWLSISNECMWAGVICDNAQQEVTGLDIANNNLNGPLPWELSSLTGLVYLDLNGNNLSGTIPTELIQIKFLILRYNFLEGSIQPEWLQSKFITHLFLDNNLITGTIPEGGSDIQLKHLGLGNNLLSGSLPRDMFAYTILGSFWVNGNSKVSQSTTACNKFVLLALIFPSYSLILACSLRAHCHQFVQQNQFWLKFMLKAQHCQGRSLLKLVF